jgi:molybdenum cofactor cytidylyltransferase
LKEVVLGEDITDSLSASGPKHPGPERLPALVGYNRPVMTVDPTANKTAGDAGRCRAPRIAAVVLAAGRSSRMGTPKALLPVGGVTAVERVVASLRQVGVGQIVVVTGHEPDPLLPVLEALAVDRAHNLHYDSGMFSSVQTGAAALGSEMDAFFVMPVDCPLVTGRVLGLLLQEHDRSHADATYPACCDRRGHPPLLTARLASALQQADREGTLQTFLGGAATVVAEVDVRDLTVLIDMDTPVEHRMVDRIATILDAAGRGSPLAAPDDAATETAPREEALPGRGSAGAPRDGGPGRAEAPPKEAPPEPALAADEALFLLAAAGTPENVVAHCRAVAAVGEPLAEALKPHLPALDVALVRTGCLLHDLARLMPNHALLAEELLVNLGLPRLGEVVGEHMVLEAGSLAESGVTEVELVYLADKIVSGDELVGLDERETRAFRKKRPGPEAAERLRARMRDARYIADKVEAITGRRLDDILARQQAAAGPGAPAAGPVLQVLLVRHARPVGPGGRRFVGHSDLPLAPAGVEQAGRLADRLMKITGGACFDSIYGSDLRRSLQTAEIVAERCGRPVVAEPWLRELDVGLWEGMTPDEAAEKYPTEYQRRELDLVGQPCPGGESFEELERRVVPGFLDLVTESLAAGQRRILVVGHKGANRVLLAHLQGLPLADIFSIKQDYCALTQVLVSRDGAGGLRVTIG